MLDPRVWWPLFPLLLLIVVVCLTTATVYAARRSKDAATVWLQSAALGFYLLAAAAALASERGIVHSDLHRPFSLLTQVAIVAVLVRTWKKNRTLMALNAGAWAAILADTALHFLMAR